ncbi:MAG TPA: hypothetical protein DDZ88_03985 [Verrucomicrobiales bacterium]|nr:hypothetical protein [Verrucomicrobiales bacterium]
MKHRQTTIQPLQAGAAFLCMTLVSCSTQPGNTGGTAPLKTKHPNLLLRPENVSSKLLISEADLQGGRRMHATMSRVGKKALKTSEASAAVLVLPCIPLCFHLISDAMVWALGGDPQIFWSAIEDPERHTLSDGSCPQIKLSGNEIRYRSAKTGHGIELARAVGDARIDVSDQHGSYYCRAEEIHYRAATKEIILKGRVSVSASYAPGISDFGLTRIDLARCILEYSSGE